MIIINLYDDRDAGEKGDNDDEENDDSDRRSEC